MKAELLIFGVTGFLVANTYYDGKYTQMLQGWQKYLKMTMFAFIGLSLYVLIKKNRMSLKGYLNMLMILFAICLLIKIQLT